MSVNERLKLIVFTRMRHGFMILGTVGGAEIGQLLYAAMGPAVSDRLGRASVEMGYTLFGAIVGCLVVTSCLLYRNAFRLGWRPATCIEVAVVCAIIAVLGYMYRDVQCRIDERPQKWSKAAPSQGINHQAKDRSAPPGNDEQGQ
jgi:hypothetical protein